MKRIFIILLFISVLNTLNAQSLKQITLPAKPSGSSQLKLSEIAADIEYVPLEYNVKALLSDMAYCSLITKEHLFITMPGTLYIFSGNGKFIAQCVTQGRGPGEGFVRCFAVDEKNQLVYVYNHFAHNILVFNCEGKFIRSFRDPFDETMGTRVDGLTWDPGTGNIFVIFDGSEGKMLYKYAVMDANGKILHSEPNYDKFKLDKRVLEVAFLPSPFYWHQDMLFYKFMYNDTIFQVNANYSCSPAYTVRLPRAVTLEERLKTGANIVPYYSVGVRNSINTIIESESLLFFYHSSNIFDNQLVKNHLSLFDKQKDRLTSYFEQAIINDWDGGMNVKHFGSQGKYMYGLFQPFDLKEELTAAHFSKSKALYPEQQKKLKTMVDQMDVEDNPVLMIVTLK
jgi:hypothetical protein